MSAPSCEVDSIDSFAKFFGLAMHGTLENAENSAANIKILQAFIDQLSNFANPQQHHLKQELLGIVDLNVQDYFRELRQLYT